MLERLATLSNGDTRLHFGVRFVLLQSQAVQQPLQLPARYSHGRLITGLLWPLELPAIQAAIVEPEAVMVPVQYLELVATPVTEDEEAAAEQVQIEAVLYYRGETVYGFAKVGSAAGEIHRACAAARG